MFQGLRQVLRDCVNATAFLTVLPVHHAGGPAGGMFAAFPLIGVILGGALAGAGLLRPFLPGESGRVALLLLWIALTGGLHLDGLGDACDGLLAPVPLERRRAILKDPRVGTFGVIGLVLLLLGKYALLGVAAPWTLLLTPMLGRWTISLAALLPAAQPPGLGAMSREGYHLKHTVIASLFTLMVLGGAVVCVGSWEVLVLALMPPLLVLTFGRWAVGRSGGGLTGDSYGALCELSELACLFAGALL